MPSIARAFRSKKAVTAGWALVSVLLLQQLLWGRWVGALHQHVFNSKDTAKPSAVKQAALPAKLLHHYHATKGSRGSTGAAVSAHITVKQLQHQAEQDATAVQQQPAANSSSAQEVVRLHPQPTRDAAAINTSTSTSTSTTTSSSSSSSVSSVGGSAPAPASHSSVLAPVLAAAVRSRSDPSYFAKLKEAASKPINIAVMTGLFWQLPTTHTQGCTVDGIPLDCHIQNGGSEEFLSKADALYYHVPSFSGQPRPKAFPEQLRLAMSLESAAYYPNLDAPSFMCQFDAEMTYRTCAQVTNWYSLESLDKLFSIPPIPYEEKLHAIAYINSNCGAQSGRSAIMRQLIALGDKAKVPVHALGRCDNNTPWPPGRPNKVQVMRRYKFCVAMENSVRQDYMTEKMWDGLMAGCVPIYLGSSNAPAIIPDPNSIILYDPSGKSGNASTPEQLDALMHRIGSDKARYEAMVAWKHKQPEEQPSEIFRYLWGVRHTTGECFLCQFLARHRAEPKPRYTTCLFNKEWMASAGQLYVPQEQACQQQGAKHT